MDTDDSVYFLTAGSARVIIFSEAGKAVTFRSLEQGDMLGELAALDGNPRSASVEVVTPCTIAKLSGSDFCELMETDGAVAKNMCAHLVAQIRSLTSRIYEFSTLAVQNRIHAELLRLACPDNQDGVTACISPSPLHIDIASRISTHREAVTRELGRLRKAGIITKEGADLRINDIVQLTKMVHSATKE